MSDPRGTPNVHKPVPQPSAPTYTAPRNDISLNISYFKTGPGIVKLVEIIIGIIVMACTAPAWTSGTHWFLFVVVAAFVATLLWSFIYLLNLKGAITLQIDWLLTEFCITALFVLLYLTGCFAQFHSLVSAPRPPNRLKPFYTMAGIFGILNLLAYTAGSFFLYRDWKETHPNSSLAGNVIKRNP